MVDRPTFSLHVMHILIKNIGDQLNDVSESKILMFMVHFEG